MVLMIVVSFRKRVSPLVFRACGQPGEKRNTDYTAPAPPATQPENEEKKEPQITQITQIKKIEREAIEHKRSP